MITEAELAQMKAVTDFSLVTLEIGQDDFDRLPPKTRELLSIYARNIGYRWGHRMMRFEIAAHRLEELGLK